MIASPIPPSSRIYAHEPHSNVHGLDSYRVPPPIPPRSSSKNPRPATSIQNEYWSHSEISTPNSYHAPLAQQVIRQRPLPSLPESSSCYPVIQQSQYDSRFTNFGQAESMCASRHSTILYLPGNNPVSPPISGLQNSTRPRSLEGSDNTRESSPDAAVPTSLRKNFAPSSLPQIASKADTSLSVGVRDLSLNFSSRTLQACKHIELTPSIFLATHPANHKSLPRFLLSYLDLVDALLLRTQALRLKLLHYKHAPPVSSSTTPVNLLRDRSIIWQRPSMKSRYSDAYRDLVGYVLAAFRELVLRADQVLNLSLAYHKLTVGQSNVASLPDDKDAPNDLYTSKHQLSKLFDPAKLTAADVRSALYALKHESDMAAEWARVIHHSKATFNSKQVCASRSEMEDSVSANLWTDINMCFQLDGFLQCLETCLRASSDISDCPDSPVASPCSPTHWQNKSHNSSTSSTSKIQNSVTARDLRELLPQLLFLRVKESRSGRLTLSSNDRELWEANGWIYLASCLEKHIVELGGSISPDRTGPEHNVSISSPATHRYLCLGMDVHAAKLIKAVHFGMDRMRSLCHHTQALQDKLCRISAGVYLAQIQEITSNLHRPLDALSRASSTKERTQLVIPSAFPKDETAAAQAFDLLSCLHEIVGWLSGLETINQKSSMFMTPEALSAAHSRAGQLHAKLAACFCDFSIDVPMWSNKDNSELQNRENALSESVLQLRDAVSDPFCAIATERLIIAQSALRDVALSTIDVKDSATRYGKATWCGQPVLLEDLDDQPFRTATQRIALTMGICYSPTLAQIIGLVNLNMSEHHSDAEESPSRWFALIEGGSCPQRRLGPLSVLLQVNMQVFNAFRICMICRSVVSALLILQTHGVPHPGVRPSNILVTSDLREVKLAGLWSAPSSVNDEVEQYMPPELKTASDARSEHGLSVEAHVYQVGMLLSSLFKLCGNHEADEAQASSSLVFSMLQKDPWLRPSLDDVLASLDQEIRRLKQVSLIIPQSEEILHDNQNSMSRMTANTQVERARSKQPISTNAHQPFHRWQLDSKRSRAYSGPEHSNSQEDSFRGVSGQRPLSYTPHRHTVSEMNGM